MIQTTDNRFVGLREPKEFVEVVLAKFPDPLKDLTAEKTGSLSGVGFLYVSKRYV
jgi:hypothetical protein